MENNGAYSLYDEGSASGTYRNFDRVGLTPHPLQDNDEIHFGRVHLRFRINRGGQSGPTDDSTQIFGPGVAPMRPAPVPAGEDTGTQIFNPHEVPAPGRSGPEPGQPDDEDLEDTSTQPFMPHH